MSRRISRRSMLRGLVGGTAVSVGLPVFDCLLNDHGTAYADTTAIPKRFGVFFWGNGFADRGSWAPSTTGAGWAATGALSSLSGVRDDVTIVSGSEVKTGGHGHHAGGAGIMTGARYLDLPGEGIVTTAARPSIDQVVASHFGAATPFRSVEVRTTHRFIDSEGTLTQHISYNGPNDPNPGEDDPGELFRRLFTGDFMPGAAPTTDPRVAARMRMRGSVLDAVLGDARELSSRLGASDRDRLEQHLEGIRDLELRIASLEMDTMVPPPASCVAPTDPGTVIEGETEADRTRYHEIMTDLIVTALACDRTRVFSYQYGSVTDQTRYPWIIRSEHHGLTHDEGGDQPNVARIVDYILGRYAYMVERLGSMPVGSGTLLDHCAVLGTTDVTYGENHTEEDFPILIAGRAGGALRSGIHHRVPTDDNASKALLTLVRAMDVPVTEFGDGEGLATETISAIET